MTNIMVVKYGMQNAILDVKELSKLLHDYQEFHNGSKEALKEAANVRSEGGRTNKYANVFNGLVYQKDCELSKKDLILDKKVIIVKGRFSNTYRAITQDGEKEVTVEICNKKCPKDMFRALLSEIKMLCYVGTHENIVEFVGCYTKEIRDGALWIAREYFSRVNLQEYLQISKKGNLLLIGTNELVRFTQEIACGMEYLCYQKVVHGDLRTRHVYLDQNKVCKVGNFGLERKRLEYDMLIKEGKRDMLPWRWMACETLTSLEFSHRSDVWAFGVTAWEIFSSGELPYGTASNGSQTFISGLVNGKRLPCPTHAAAAIYEALLESWNLKPEQRPEFSRFVYLFTDMLQIMEMETVRDKQRNSRHIATTTTTTSTPVKTSQKNPPENNTRKALINTLQDEKKVPQSIALQNSHELSKESLQVHFDHILGVGQFGVVHRATLLDSHPIDVAVKMVRDSNQAGTLKGMWTEIDLLCKIGSHSNVVKFLGCYTAEIQKGVLWIVTELCSHGSLLSFLRKTDAERDKTKLPVRDMFRFSFEIASGMEYISGKNIIHGDLAARNVLLDLNKTCKIGDFGLSRNLYKYEMYIRTRQEPLPWKWLAYESLKKSEFSVQTDVWSYGVTLWEVFTLGDVPYPGLAWTVDFVNKLEGGLRLPHPKHAAIETYEKMKLCWRIKSEERPTFSDLTKYFNEQLQQTYHTVINIDL